MGITYKVVSKGNQFQEVMKNITVVHGENVEVGHFAESGTHYSGYSYPQLMEIHHFGSLGHVSRPVLNVLFHKYFNMDSPKVRAAINDWGNEPPTPSSLNRMLNMLGEVLMEAEKDIFGNPAEIGPVTSNPTPLVLTHDLVDNTSYRTSIDKVIKGGA
jgi:hypothetical protein